VIMAGIPHLPGGVVFLLAREQEAPVQALAQPRDVARRETSRHR
jgi:hypothetical protein